MSAATEHRNDRDRRPRAVEGICFVSANTIGWRSTSGKARAGWRSFATEHGELLHAASWFRFAGGGLLSTHRLRTNAPELMEALTPKLIEAIERLHRRAETASSRDGGAWLATTSAAKRWLERLAGFRAQVSPGRVVEHR